MSLDEPTDAKRQRLDTDAAPIEGSGEGDEILIPATENEVEENSEAVKGDEGISDEILHAARLSDIIRHLPKTNFKIPTSILAWSVTNIIAIARSTKITLTHLLGSSRAFHISIPEKPNILTFSPRGDALLASFPESSSIYLWACNSNTLNQWTLRGSWTQVGGRVLDVRWLGEGRQRSPSSLSRIVARGPQLSSKEDDLIAALIVSDAGQLRLISGNLKSSIALPCYQHQISLNSNQRLRQIKIGLVPDEPIALLAYTLRFSSKANLPHTSGAGDAIDMFFDGAEGTDSSSGAPMPIDGQDQIGLTEVRIDLYPAEQSLAMYSRSLDPIHTSTFEEKPMPSTEFLNQLEWVDAESSGKDEGVELQLFTSFFEDGNSYLRLWKIKREDGTHLSDAFGKLETAKIAQTSNEDDEWAAQSSINLTVENEQLSDFVCSAWMENRLLCTSRPSSSIERLEDVPKVTRTFKVIDTKSMELRVIESDESLLKKCNDSLCRISVSPHATMLAGIGKGKVVLAPISGLHDESVDDISLYGAAILDNQDLSDLIKSNKIPVIPQIASRLKFGQQLSLHNGLQLTSLNLRFPNKGDTSSLNGLLLLELATAFRLVKSARGSEEGSFKLSRIWALVAQLEWIVNVLEMIARQAHLLHVKMTAITPSSTEDADKEVKPDNNSEPNLLSLMMTHIPRQLLAKIIIGLVAFYNWLEDIMEGDKDTSKSAFTTFAMSLQKSSLVTSETMALGGPTKVSEMLQLAHVRVREIVQSSSIDISQAGRFLNSFKEVNGSNDEDERQWYLTPQASLKRQENFAEAFLASKSVRNMLNLFCPPSEWKITPLGQEEDMEDDWDENEDGTFHWSRFANVNRDILSKAILPKGGSVRRICLSCNGQTQVDVSSGIRCMCGSATWWAVRD